MKGIPTNRPPSSGPVLLDRLKNLMGGYRALAEACDLPLPTLYKYRSEHVVPPRDRVIRFALLEASIPSKDSGASRNQYESAREWLTAFGHSVGDSATHANEVASVASSFREVGFDEWPLAAAIKAFQRRWTDLELTGRHEYEGTVRALMNAMGHNDHWLYFSAEGHPLGIVTREVGKTTSARSAMVAAADRGAKLSILRPTGDIYKAMSLIADMPSEERIERDFRDFIEQGIQAAGSLKSPLIDVQLRFKLILADKDCPFIVPGLRFTLIRCNPEKSGLMAAFVLVRAAESEEEHPTRIPLHRDVARALNNSAINILMGHSKKDDYQELIAALRS